MLEAFYSRRMMSDEYLRICDNCSDFDRANRICMIRFTLSKDKKRVPMKRLPSQNGCKVFMFKARTGY